MSKTYLITRFLNASSGLIKSIITSSHTPKGRELKMFKCSEKAYTHSKYTTGSKTLEVKGVIWATQQTESIKLKGR